MNFKSFAILDLETTNLSFAKITELAVVACERTHCEDTGTLPRVLHKFTVCVKPASKIHPISSVISGLDNESLVNVGMFNEDVVESLRLFLQRLPQPVCFVAHNGDKFDFRVLKEEILRAGAPTLEDIYCVDSLPAFRELLTRKAPVHDIPHCPLLDDSYEDSICLIALEQYETKLNISSSSSQALNESTPPRGTRPLIWAPKKVHVKRTYAGNTTARRKLDLSGDASQQKDEPLLSFDTQNLKSQLDLRRKPKSYKLGDIYEYFHGFSPIDAHRAENDAIALLECIVKVSVSFFDYADRKAVLFNAI